MYNLEYCGKYELNKIYNEDSYQAIKDIPDKSIDCIYVDIPYLYDGYNKHNNNVGVGIKEDMLNSLKDMINGIDYSIYNDFIRVMKKVNMFIWLSYEQLIFTLKYFNDLGYLTRILFWGKTNPVPLANNTWLSDVEYCLHIKEKGLLLNSGFDFKRSFYVSGKNINDKKMYEHPTIKPIEFVKNNLLHTTQPNDIVADFFLGSGTTCVAAKELGRRYIGFEIDEGYYKIAKDRLDGINQIERKQIDSGQISLF